jgi:hypothetical protein
MSSRAMIVLGALGLATAAVAFAGSTVASSAPAAASGSSAWLHVRVEEPKNDSRVSVNLPMAVVEAALAAAPEKIVSDGKVHLGLRGKDLSVADLRRAWRELRATGDAEFVSVEEKDEHVSVALKGSLVQVRVKDTGSREEVHVDVPVAVVDALFSGEGESLNLKAGAASLRTLRGDIVRVNDKDTTVRVWIDERN